MERQKERDNLGGRYAFEWYVNEQDEWYYRRALENHKANYRRIKRITALAATSTVISLIAITIALFVLLRM